MAVATVAKTSPDFSQTRQEVAYEQWNAWPVNWTAVSVGVLTAVSLVTIFGLIAVAIGAHQFVPDERLVDLRKLGRGTVIFSISVAFFSFVAAGWVAGKIAGILYSEPAMLHGAILWAAAVPVLALLTAIGVGGDSGAWYNGLHSKSGSAAPFSPPTPVRSNPSDYERSQYDAAVSDYARKVELWKTETPRVIRNTALCTATALLLGLMGSVVGGWMSSGEPMSLTYKRPARKYEN